MYIIIGYSVIVGIALLFLFGYTILIRRKDPWMCVLFSSVTVATFGYLLEAVTNNHIVAIIANDLAYLGAIVTMLATLILIKELCGFTPSRLSLVVLFSLAGIMFAIVALHPILPLYYRDTWIETLNGVTFLKKDYGPLYMLYKIYIVAYLVTMVTIIIVSIKKHRIHSYKIVTLLFLVATINCVVWRIQRWIGTPFNMLPIAYIIGAFILFYLFWLMQDYVHHKHIATPDPVVIEKVVYVAKELPDGEWSASRVSDVLRARGKSARLTDTETKVLVMLLNENSRKDISLKFSVSENTVKSHISHIYTKLGVGSKEGLRELFALDDEHE